ncbi:membrane-bound glycerophospholipid O-acyltransferase 2-like [Tubulanus polymorphus]|uniref:membrane-bound glycerophospholipid O-acyltransferase 2-like n=1 Tax=Tubulanus polymorphus TaxID=672921 RepID=UPI003DA20FFF
MPSTVYAGSRMLNPVAEILSIPIDQLNFVCSQIIAICVGVLYRIYLHPTKVSANIRHGVAFFLGTSLGLFCFGRQMIHVFLQSTVCYLLLKFSGEKIRHKLVFAWSMVYLSAMHIFRQIYDYRSYTLDITGPLMVTTMKLTSLAFALKDGMQSKEAFSQLNVEQKRRAVDKLPNLLTYFSYLLYFHGMLVGPFCFFDDYIVYIEGRTMQHYAPDQYAANVPEPSPNRAVIEKLCISVVCVVIVFGLAVRYPEPSIMDPKFIAVSGFFYRVLYSILVVALARAKYYFAWKLSEAANNAAGLGFDGFDESGNARWDLVNNVKIRNLEMATSVKLVFDSWNIMTSKWLRYVCYDRAPAQKTVLTFGLSAIWHGFYPGYYFTFISGSFFLAASRKVRRHIRPYFLASPTLKSIYDVITWFFCQLTLGHLVVPFSLLEFVWCVQYFNSFYWFMHISVLLILVAPVPHSGKTQKKNNGDLKPAATSTTSSSDNQTSAAPSSDTDGAKEKLT